MILVIDRGNTLKNIYKIEFGICQDVLIGTWDFFIPSIKKEDMAELDRLVTNSPNLVFCITHIKHPLLLKDYTSNDNNLSQMGNFFKNVNEIAYKKKLREYFAIRLIHRKYDLKLYEFGKRFF